jgi:hypothetical protein
MLDRMMVSGAAPAAQSGPYATDESQQNTNSASGGAGQLVTLPTAGSVAPKGDGFGLAREDLLSCRWDWDSDDSVMMIESVTGVPEPAGLFLLGAGLLGLGVARRRVTRA